MFEVPPTMEATVVDRFGPPNVLRPRRIAVPRPGPKQVLIALHAVGVGVWDIQLRDGSWQPQGDATSPALIGTDGAGIIVEVGDQVSGFSLGDWVYAYGLGGFYAEYVAVDAIHVGHMALHLNFLEAAAASATGLTTLQGLDDVLKVSVGDTLLIIGASGAMGTLAVQFAKLRGARVIATASGREARDLVLGLGADGVLDIRSQDGLKQLQELAPTGVDVSFVLGAGPTLETYLSAVRIGGRIAFPYGVNPEPQRRPGISVVGYNVEAGPQELARLTQSSADARLRVPIAAVYPLAEASKAHERLEQGHTLGRIVLRTDLKLKPTRRLT
jgi:NADPH:quinone reductase